MKRILAAGAALLLACFAWAAYLWTTTPYRVVALTFDDGPSAYTAPLLEILDSLHVTATFLFLGRSVERHPELVRAVRAHGHELGTHTYSHPHLGRLSPAAGEAEIARGIQLVRQAANARPAVFRAPYGDEPAYLEDTCRKLGISLIPLGVPGFDWEKRPPGRIAAEIITHTTPGSFILLHDGSDVPDADRSRTVAAVPVIVGTLQDRGFRFVTASQLTAARSTAGFRIHDLTRRALLKLQRGLLRRPRPRH